MDPRKEEDDPAIAALIHLVTQRRPVSNGHGPHEGARENLCDRGLPAAAAGPKEADLRGSTQLKLPSEPFRGTAEPNKRRRVIYPHATPMVEQPYQAFWDSWAEYSDAGSRQPHGIDGFPPMPYHHSVGRSPASGAPYPIPPSFPPAYPKPMDPPFMPDGYPPTWSGQIPARDGPLLPWRPSPALHTRPSLMRMRNPLLRYPDGPFPLRAPMDPYSYSMSGREPGENMMPSSVPLSVSPKEEETHFPQVKDLRRWACMLVDWSLIHGMLPCFGAEAEKLVMKLSYEDPVVKQLISEKDLTEWQEFLSTNDPETTLIRYKVRNGRMNSVGFRALFGTKISEHWSYKSKTLLRTVKTDEELNIDSLRDGDICQRVADWLNISVTDLKPKAITLVFWRVNKHLRGTNLRKELTVARSTTGSGVRGGHKIARSQWVQELDDEYKTLFPNGDDKPLQEGKRAARSADTKGGVDDP